MGKAAGSLTNSPGPVVDVGLLAGLLITDLNLRISLLIKMFKNVSMHIIDGY